MGLSKSLLNAPYFIFSLFFFYWSTSISFLCHRIRFTDFFGKRNDLYDWAVMVNDFFGVKFVKFGQQSLFKNRRCVYLCNHRSWADFFVDIYLTEGLAAPMSRAMVFFAFPVFMAAAITLKGVVLFKRGRIEDKQKFNKWLDDKLSSSHIHNLLVYPEGHRSTLPKSLPLKRGMLHYAHSRGLPVQVIITRNKEAVLSEKQHSAGFGVTCVVGFSEVIQSEGPKDFEAFWTEVHRVWDTMWTDVNAADAKGLPELRQDDVPAFDYSMAMRLQMLACGIGSIALLALALHVTVLCIIAVLGYLPAMLRVIALVTALLLFGISVGSCIVRSSSTGGKGSKAA